MTARCRRSALVTGASSGIGKAFAELFARDGFDVILVARSAPALARVADDLKLRYGVGALPIACDLSVTGAPAGLFERVQGDGASVEALVNSAGFAAYGEFRELALDIERAMIAVNVLALTELTKLFLAPMLAAGTGRILNVASTAAFLPGPLMAVYYATKAYVLSFSEAIAEELKGSGVTVTCLCPGSTESGFQSRAGMEESALVHGRKLPDASSVALAGYRAMNSGKVLEVPGFVNRATALLPRLFPRAIVPGIVRRAQERVR